MAFADLTANLNLNIQNFSRALRRADSQYQSFVSRASRFAQSHASQTQGLVENYERMGNSMHYLGLSARDVSRIFSGIIVSQAFYRTAEAIKEATAALWEFNEQLDYARVTYAALMGDSSISQGFLSQLQQFSIETVFGFSDLEKMSRKLLAYGIEYKNLMYIVQGLTNIGTLSGDPAALERLAVAIGQINAKGTLKAEEVRQLTNAYVPMYDILREELGFTSEDLKKNIGDLGISSADAINAIMSYSNKRFGETAEAAMLTITGLNQRIVDSVKVMGSDMMQPVANAYKSLAHHISQELEYLYSIYKSRRGGAGGIFEHLVPGEYAQQLIREFIANFINGIYRIVGILHASMPLIKGFFSGFVQGLNFANAVFNAFGSVVVAVLRTLGIHTPVLNILSKALYMAGFAFAIFVARAMAAFALRGLVAVFTGIARAIMLLTIALSRNPIVLGLIAITGVMAALTTRANSANNAVTSLVKTLSSYSLGGSTADDILQPTVGGKTDTGNADDYWNQMEENAESTEDAINDAGKAAKKANKSLLSFDEVFRLNEPSDSGSSSGNPLSGIENLGDALGGALGGALMPTIPSFKDFAKNFVNNLYNDLWEALRTIASGATSGALIGGLIGFAIGGLATKTMAGALGGAKIGAGIGAVVGAGFAGFWSDAYKEMEASLLKIGTAGTAGALVGALVGFVLGALATKNIKSAMYSAMVFANIGSLLGAGLGGFWALATEEMNNAIEGLAVGAATGALTGALIGLVIGAFATKDLKAALGAAALGAKIGAVVGAGLGALWGSLSETMQNQIKSIAAGIGVGALVGALTGFIIGAFATKSIGGAITGGKLGTAIGAAVGAYADPVFASAGEQIESSMNNMLKNFKAMGYGIFFGALAGMIIGAVVGAMAGGVGAIPGAMAGARLGAALGGLGQMLYQMLENSGAIEGMLKWFKELGGKIKTMWAALWDAETWKTAWEHIKGWFSKLLTDVSDWFEDTFGISVKDLWETIWKVAKWLPGWRHVSLWFSVLNGDVKDWFTDRVSDIKSWWENLWTTSRWATAWSKVTGWFSTLKADTNEWFTSRVADIKAWWENLWTTSRWVTAWSKVTGWFESFKISTKSWFDSRIADVKSWWENLWTTSRWATAWSKVTGWFSTLRTDVSSWFTSRIPDVKSWWENLWSYNKWATGWNKVRTWFSTLRTEMSSWFTSRVSDVTSWWGGLWNYSKWTTGWNKIKTWFSDLKKAISNWFTNLKTSIGSWWDNLWEGKKGTVKDNGGGILGSLKLGHATGGIFNREHIARFAEGNKAEAIIPLENNRAMQPFVDAVAGGLLQSLAPTLMSAGGSRNSSESLPPMYVGTLVADERGLKELYKKFEVIQMQESARRGLNPQGGLYGF